jgi:hypothetical protein
MFETPTRPASRRAAAGQSLGEDVGHAAFRVVDLKGHLVPEEFCRGPQRDGRDGDGGELLLDEKPRSVHHGDRGTLRQQLDRPFDLGEIRMADSTEDLGDDLANALPSQRELVAHVLERPRPTITPSEPGDNDRGMTIRDTEAPKQPKQGGVDWFRRDLLGASADRRQRIGHGTSPRPLRAVERLLEEMAQRAEMGRGDVTKARIVGPDAFSPLLLRRRQEVLAVRLVEDRSRHRARERVGDDRELENALHSHRRECEKIAIRQPLEPGAIKEVGAEQGVAHPGRPGHCFR